jgi:hypothetical protein
MLPARMPTASAMSRVVVIPLKADIKEMVVGDNLINMLKTKYKIKAA